jgi:hypothetical protein
MLFNTRNIIQNYHKKKQLGLNFEQMWILFLLYEVKKNNNKEAGAVLQEVIETFIKATGEGIIKEGELNKLVIPLREEDRNSLIKKGLFKKLNNREDGKIDVVLNMELCDKLFISIEDAFYQLLDTFANVTLKFKNGTVMQCNNIDDIKEYKKLYYDAINGSLTEHEQVIDACKYAIKKGIVNSGLQKIITNRSWNAWKTMSKTNDVAPQTVIKTI